MCNGLYVSLQNAISVPFDYNRVPLARPEEDKANDYINASLIKDFEGNPSWIVTQGPMETKIEDFWQLVWEQNSSIIVMLTKVK
jgi:protein tyrosine phosphatase